jgi:putative transcriptional regulator
VVEVGPDGSAWKIEADGGRTRLKGTTNWKQLDRISPAELRDAALADPDAQPTTEADWEDAWRPAALRQLRRRLKLSQAAFARRYGLNLRTVQDWEQGRKIPDQAVRTLVRLIERAPDKIAAILRQG